MVKPVSVFDSSSRVPQIDPRKGKLDEASAAQLSDYMDAGAILMRTTLLRPDIFSNDDTPKVPSSMRTDGEFVWSDATSYYVRHYQVSPGEEFLQHAESLGFRVPSISDAEAASLAQDLRQHRRVG